MLGEQAKRYPEMIRRIEEAGHTLGNHTYNHEYKELYDSFGHFWKQIKATEEVLRGITGERTPLVRAPGGRTAILTKRISTCWSLGAIRYSTGTWTVGIPAEKESRLPKS